MRYANGMQRGRSHGNTRDESKLVLSTFTIGDEQTTFVVCNSRSTVEETQ